MKINKYLASITLTTLIAACGGGGGGGSTTTPTPTSSTVILTVNKDGIYQTAPYSTSTNLIQNNNSGYFVSSNVRQEWTGSGLGYTNGYINPTSGTLYSYNVSSQSTGDFWWSISNLNYNASLSSPSLDASVLPFNALGAATETKIYGGVNNDKTMFFLSTSEVDLGTGNDTLILSQTYSTYQFSKVSGSTTSIYVTRDGHQTLVKNVESFQFSNITKTLTEILSSIP